MTECATKLPRHEFILECILTLDALSIGPERRGSDRVTTLSVPSSTPHYHVGRNSQAHLWLSNFIEKGQSDITHRGWFVPRSRDHYGSGPPPKTTPFRSCISASQPLKEPSPAPVRETNLLHPPDRAVSCHATIGTYLSLNNLPYTSNDLTYSCFSPINRFSVTFGKHIDFQRPIQSSTLSSSQIPTTDRCDRYLRSTTPAKVDERAKHDPKKQR